MAQAQATPVTKSREERLAELKARMESNVVKSPNTPYITTDGVMKDGKIVLLLDVLALEDGVHPSSTGKANVAFTTFEIKGLGRFNVNNIRK